MRNRTPKIIADAFNQLLKEKPLSGISVKDICTEAGIQRPTFYYYFSDKYDLTACIILAGAEQVDPSSLDSLVLQLRHLQKEYGFYRRVLDETSQNEIRKYLQEYFIHQYTQAALKKLQADSLPDDVAFSLRLYCHGAMAMTKEWLMNSHAVPVEKEAEYLAGAMPEKLKKLFEVRI